MFMDFLIILADLVLGTSVVIIGVFVLSLIADLAVKNYRDDE